MNKILVAIDFSAVTQPTLQVAQDFAAASHASVCLLHVAEPDPDFVGYDAGPQSVRDQIAERFHNEHRQLQEFAEAFRARQIETTPLLIQGPTHETILAEAKKFDAHLIVLGSHGHGALHRALVGGTSEYVLRKASCPVLIVPDPARARS